MTFKHLVMLTALGSTMSAPLLAAEMGGKEMGGMRGMNSMGGMTGGIMFEYRYMNMRMDGNREGTTSLSTSDVTAQGFMMASPEMRMDMHMLMGMYDFPPSGPA